MKHRVIDFLQDNEITALKIAASYEYNRNFVMISLALGTGLRNSELVNLTVKCIRPFDEISHFLDVPGTITKGGFSRQIPLHPDLRVLLLNFLNWKFHHNEPIVEKANLFLSKYTHNNLRPRDFQRIVRSLSLRAIGRSVSPYTLRHTFATRLLSISNLRVVQKVLGHKNIQTTQIYAHLLNNDVAEAINKLQL